jgi:superfamily II DNA helicase RecQ
MSSLQYVVPCIDDLRMEVQRTFGILPCMFQAQDAIAQLKQKDCIMISPTGSGKTLTFWILLLFNNNRIIIIITALNILGDKNVEELLRLGITAANVTGASATNDLFKVSFLFHHQPHTLIKRQYRKLKMGSTEWLWQVPRKFSMIVTSETSGS